MTDDHACVDEDGQLCGHCWSDLAARLREVPSLVEELETTLTRQDRIGAGRVGGRGTEVPLPFNEGASIARLHLRYFLGTWCRDVAERSGARLAPFTDLLDVAAYSADWLLDHEGAVRHHPAAADLAEEIGEAVWAAVRAIDRPADRVFAGWCCVALYTRPGRSTVACRVCGTERGVDECRDEMLRDLDGYHLTAVDVSRALSALGRPVTPDRIMRWHQRGKLARTPDRRYRVGDVLDMLGA